MAFQMLCVLVLVAQSLAASTAGRKWCSGDLLRGFLDKGEEGCCLPEGICHDPARAKVLAEQLEHIGKPSFRRKRSLDASGFRLREHLLSKHESTTEKQGESQALLSPLLFQEKASEKPMTCPTGCSADKMDICGVRTEVSFPAIGTSVTTKSKVHIIQAEPMFDQPVVRRICKHKYCSLLRGKCNQIYQPQLMFVDPGTLGAARMDLDYVYVESGCECSMDLTPDDSDSSMDTSEMSDSLELDDGEGNVAETEPEVKAEEGSEDESPIHTPAPEPTPEPEVQADPIHAVPEVHLGSAKEQAVPEEVHEETTSAPVAHPEEHEIVAMVGIVEVTTSVADSVDHIEDHLEDHHFEDHPEDHHEDVHHEDDGAFTMAPANLEGSEEVVSSTTTIHP